MKENLKKLIIIPIATIIFLIGYFAGYVDKQPYGYEFKVELLNALMDYETSAEILLDSISVWDKSFMDITMESEEYFQYSIRKEKIDSLYNTQL